jgi:hypothetical protein
MNSARSPFVDNATYNPYQEISTPRKIDSLVIPDMATFQYKFGSVPKEPAIYKIKLAKDQIALDRVEIIMPNAFKGKDYQGQEIWGEPATFLKDILKTDKLKNSELYENFVDKGTHYEIDSANLSSMELTELPKYWEF